MLVAAMTGFALGFSLILAIGAQNAFVLRQGLRREFVLPVVLTCAISDAILIVVGVSGFSVLTETLPRLAPAMRWAGAAFLIAYGIFAFQRAWRGGDGLDPAAKGSSSMRAAVLTCLALTWLNPHVYLDTVLLIGAAATQWPGMGWAFGTGAVTASFTFFFALGYGARLMAPVMSRPGAWRVLDAVIGVVMWAIAAGLILKG